jgi:HK97 family phage major capsid protein
VSNRPILKTSPLALAEEAKAVFARADAEGRILDQDEREYVETLLTRAEERGDYERRMKATGLFGDSGQMLSAGDYTAGAAALTPGQIFTSSPGFKQLFDGDASLPERWSTGSVELPGHWQTKGTLLEGSGAPGSGSGGGLIAAPQVVPGVVETLFQQLHLADLMLSGVASTSTIRYVNEGTATSGAAGVAEGGTKPESTLGLSTKDEPLKKIATFLPISSELLEDAPAVQQFITGRLSYFIRIEEERQLLRGQSTGNTNEVQGLLYNRSVPVYTGGTADNKAVQMFKALNSVRGSAYIEPDWIVMSPSDYQVIRLLTDTAGQFFGGGPFLGPYGGPQGPVGASGQIVGNDMLWGKPLYVSAALSAGTALIGTVANAQIWRRGGVSVEASNSHGSFFQLNLVALRAEERLALAVYRASGFCEVRLATGPGG